MKRKRNKPKAVYTPADREVIKAVIQGACNVYDITEDELMTNVSTSIAYLRFYCFWLLAKNTDIKEYAIAEKFGKTREAIVYGISQIDSQRNVYPDTARQLRMIAEAANGFHGKKFEWLIQSTNIIN